MAPANGRGGVIFAKALKPPFEVEEAWLGGPASAAFDDRAPSARIANKQQRDFMLVSCSSESRSPHPYSAGARPGVGPSMAAA
jgi:hypothetical protein